MKSQGEADGPELRSATEEEEDVGVRRKSRRSRGAAAARVVASQESEARDEKRSAKMS